MPAAQVRYFAFRTSVVALIKYIAVFCGARSGPDDRYLPLAAETGRLIAQRGIGLVFGGGKVGMMGALADAAIAAGGETFGVIPERLAAEEAAHRGLTGLHFVNSMHERKNLMARLSDAFIALPGGIGTLDEFFEILTWKQLQLHEKPIGLLNHNGYYDPLLKMFDQLLKDGMVVPSTLEQLIVAPTIEELLTKLGA